MRNMKVLLITVQMLLPRLKFRQINGMTKMTDGTKSRGHNKMNSLKTWLIMNMFEMKLNNYKHVVLNYKHVVL